MSERRRKDWRTNRAIANLETARVRFGLDPGAGVPPDYRCLSEAVTKLAIVFEGGAIGRPGPRHLLSDALVMASRPRSTPRPSPPRPTCRWRQCHCATKCARGSLL